MKRDKQLTAYERLESKFNRLNYILRHYKVALEGLASKYDKARSICDNDRQAYNEVFSRNNNLSYIGSAELSEEQIKEEQGLEARYDFAAFKEDTCKKAFNHTVKSMFEEIAKEDFSLF